MSRAEPALVGETAQRWASVAPGRRRRAFTLMEMMVVVGVVGIMTGLAAFSVNRSQDRIQVERSAASLRAEVERARALARVAGPRLGTARIRYGADCSNPGGGLLWIDINPTSGDVFIPQNVRYDEATDRLDVDCVRWDYGGLRGAETEASFAFPAARLIFGFTANGRLAFPPGVARQDVFVQLRHDASNSVLPGFRVLPAGITCVSGEPNRIIEPCDEDMP